MFNYQDIIDKYYATQPELRRIYMLHCRSVADKALSIAHRLHLPVDMAEVEAAAMLHDIGIVLTDAPGIHCYGTQPYLAHGRLGADLLRSGGAPEIYARVAERHTGAGLTQEEAAAIGGGKLPPDRSYMPQSLLERLVCYADKFYSKSGDMQEKPLERVRASMARFGADSSARFEALHREFGADAAPVG